jgi:hypothetical protein
MRTLYDIRADVLALESALERVETTDDHDAAERLESELKEFTEQLYHEQADKLESYRVLIAKLENEADAANLESQAFAMLAESKRSRAKLLKDRLKEHMIATGFDELETSTGRKIKLCANGGPLPIAIDPTIDLDSIPTQYIRVKKSIDADEVRDALRAGAEFDWVKVLPRGKHIRIK